jgi:hypothetical protein
VESAMAKWNLEALNERERACLGHLEQAKRLGVSFSRYCREKELSLHQWAWVIAFRNINEDAYQRILP